MLDKSIQIFYRVVIIITLFIILCRVSYRPYVANYLSDLSVTGDNIYSYERNEAFSNYIYETSLSEVLKEYESNNTVGRIQLYQLNIDCPVQYCENLDSDNLIGYLNNESDEGVVRTDSSKEEFDSGVTYVQGKNAKGLSYGSLKLLDDAERINKIQTFYLLNTQEKTSVYRVFCITDTLSYDDIKGLSKSELITILLENSKYELNHPTSRHKIAILMLDIGITESEWLIIGGYAVE